MATAVALIAGLFLVGTTAQAVPAPNSGPIAGGTTVSVPVPGPDSFIQVAAGGIHSIAIDASGNLWTWGADYAAQLGNGADSGDVTFPTQVTTGKTFIQVAAGGYHSVALDASGNVWAWGYDYDGEVGNGSATSSDIATPVQVTSGTEFTSIAAGESFSLAIDDEGNIWSWGKNNYGQLGSGSTTGVQVDTPTKVTTGIDFTDIAAGYAHSLALDSSGNVWSWGYDSYEQLGNGASAAYVYSPAQVTTGTTFTSIAAGRQHSLSIDSAGNVWSWGSDASNQLGNGAPTENISVPTQATSGTIFTTVSAGTTAIYSTAISADGTLWTWGFNGSGQLGTGSTSAGPTTPASIASGTAFVSISAGSDHSVALDTHGNMWSWGYNSNGQVGNGGSGSNVLSPTQISTPVSFTEVSAGNEFSIALDSEGNLWGWGYDSTSQVGNGGANENVDEPVRISAGTTFTSIAAGNLHGLALDDDGAVWSWGYDGNGQLGNGAGNANVGTPQLVDTGATRFVTIAAGPMARHSMAIDTDGKLWTWGSDVDQQLGNGAAIVDVTVPTQISTGSTTFTAIAGGSAFSLAVDSDGNVWSWGRNSLGELGNGVQSGIVDAPAAITAGTEFVSVGAGSNHALALDAAGNIWTWGNDGLGQQGNGAPTSVVTEPTQITVSARFSAIAGARNHDLAIDTEGNVWGWGNNSGGQVGDGTTSSAVIAPVQVTDSTTFTSISGGYLHSLAVDADGNLWAWGYEEEDQLGNGASSVPVTVPSYTRRGTEVTSISFAGVAGTGLTRVSNTVAQVTTPAGAAGAVDVVVTYSVLGVAKPTWKAMVFTYVAPTPTQTPTSTATPSPTPTATSGSGGASAPSAQRAARNATTTSPAVGDAPVISVQPVNSTATAGDTVTLTVNSSSAPTPTVQWQVSTDGGTTWTALEGETDWSLTVEATEDARYRAILTNDNGTTTSDEATVTATPAAEATPTATPTPVAETTDDTPQADFTWLWITVGGVTFLVLSGLGFAIFRRR